MSNLSIDELLAQATCAVLIDGQTIGTGWLVSSEGYLLTAGHLLCKEPEDDPTHSQDIYTKVKVKFVDDTPRIAHRIESDFQKEDSVDFAVLKLDNLPINRDPLPIALTRSPEGTFRLHGYGSSITGRTSGKGIFLGSHDPNDSVKNRLFQLRSQDIAEQGYSGGAVFSDQLQAVVAIQIETTISRIGSKRDTVFAMPLYRIAQYWKELESFAEASVFLPSTPHETHNFLSIVKNKILTHLLFIVVASVLEFILIAFYLIYRDLYLISWWYSGFGACLLIVTVWAWYSWSRFERTRTKLAMALLATLCMASVVGWQSWSILFPKRFDAQTFAIAVAELGEGANYKRTSDTREISGQVYNHLCQAVKNTFPGEDNQFCKVRDHASETNLIEVRQIGVISSSEIAQRYGKQIRADFVIWGQLLTSKKDSVTIRFQLVEVPDRAVNPEHPIILPVTTTTAEVLINPELDLNSDPSKLKEMITLQSTVISSYALGLVSYLKQDYPQAIKQFETAVQTLKNDSLKISPEGKSLLYFSLGKANSAAGRIEEGINWLHEGEKANQHEPAIPLALALSYASIGQEQKRDDYLESALDLSVKWLATYPSHKTALYNRGIVHQSAKDFDQSLLDFQEVIKNDPNYYIAYISGGQVAAEMDHFKQAEELLQTAIRIAEENGTNAAWAYLNLARVHQKAKQPELAKKAYRNAIEISPQVNWMHYYYAQFLEELQEMDAALKTYRTITEVERYNKGWAFGKLADFLKRRGLMQDALENYKQAIQAEPKNALLRVSLAETYLALDDTKNAMPEFEKAIELNPTIYYAYAAYANALFEAGDFERAAQIYEYSLELRPLDASVLLNLGKTYQILGQNEKAVKQYQTILELQEHFVEDILQEANERLEKIRSTEHQ